MDERPFPVIDLDVWTRGEQEPGGDDEKRWFTPPDSSENDRWLFKPRTEKDLPRSQAAIATGTPHRRQLLGEDWAEKVSYEVARLLHIPAAITQLAEVTALSPRVRRRGSMSRDMRPEHWSWTAGASLLAERDSKSFDADTCVGHTLDAVSEALVAIQPYDASYRDLSSFDVFAGYLILDALIANTDRHANNWGVLSDPQGTTFLGPTFDHGTAFGSGQDDSRFDRLVAQRSVEAWCWKGATRRFDGGHKHNLVLFAADAYARCTATARSRWLNNLTALDLDEVRAVIASVPDLSESKRTFVVTVLRTNRERLLDVLD